MTTRRKDRGQMQTFNVQLLSQVISAEAGKLPTAKPTDGVAFSTLFSQISHEESETAESSDSETPDEIVFDPELKIQLSEVGKTAVQSPDEVQVSTKKTHVIEGSGATENPHGSIMTEKASFAKPVHMEAPEHGHEAVSAAMKNSALWIAVEEKISNPDNRQTLSDNLAKGLPQQPENASLATSNPQQTIGMPVAIAPASSENQIPQLVEPRAKTNDVLISNLQQSLDNKPIAQRNLEMGPAKSATPIEQGGRWSLEPDFEQIRQATPNYAEIEKTSFVGTQNLASGNMAQTSISSLATVTQQHPSAITPPEIFLANNGADDDSFQSLTGMSETEFSRLTMNVILNPPPSTAVQATPAGVVRFAATQMVDALIRQSGQPVELVINPEELGRVRIALTTLDSGISVAIMAERPETLDLMRRNIEQLEAEFRQLGYENIGFEFSGGDAQTSKQPDTANQPTSDQTIDSTDQTLPSPMSAPANGVDIRL